MPHQSRVDASQTRQPWLLGSAQRRVRLVCGLILLSYVTLHLLDHALLNISLGAAGAMLALQKAIWRSLPGTAALYGALIVHAGLGLWSLYRRRGAGWRPTEILQLVLGLSIPAMLANHVAVTRLAWTLDGLDKSYEAELATLWVAAPAWGWLQMAVLVVAWTHACLGLSFLLRLRRWWPRWQAPLLAFAILLPSLALVGFVAGGRAVAAALANPAWRAAHLPAAITGTAAQGAHLAGLRNGFLLAYGAAITAILAARLARVIVDARGRRITIAYPGQRRIRVPAGLSVLDASRRGHIAHASICGGRGRCSTCRVRIHTSAGPQPPPAPHERAVLDAIGAADPSIRLACQFHPDADLEIIPLIPPAVAQEFIVGRAARIPGDERFVVAMFIDLRGSTGLAEKRLPFDSVFLLGRFITAATRAVTTAGGRPVQFLGDGLLALFGLHCPADQGCREALAAVLDAETAFAALAPLFNQEAGMDLRYGIGVHCGRAIVGEIGFGEQLAFTALGDTINTAHRLQELARDRNVAAVISDDVFRIAGVTEPPGPGLEAELRGRAAPLQVHFSAALTA